MTYKTNLLLSLVVLIGVLLYFVIIKPEIFNTFTQDSSQQNSRDTLSQLRINTFEELRTQIKTIDTKKTLFILGSREIHGEKYVSFAANIWRDDGERFEACILYGDGEENCIAHWSPQIFNEEESHQYKQPGTYTARLVLVPKTSITEEVRRFEKKVSELPGLIEIKSITFDLDSSGNVLVKDTAF